MEPDPHPSASSPAHRRGPRIDLTQLREVYSTIDSLEKSKVELPPVVSRDDLYRPFVLAAALLLLAEAALSSTVWLRWP